MNSYAVYSGCHIHGEFVAGSHLRSRSQLPQDDDDIQPWAYADIGKIIGAGEGYTVSNEEELSLALMAAKQNNFYPTIIDVKLDK